MFNRVELRTIGMFSKNFPGKTKIAGKTAILVFESVPPSGAIILYCLWGQRVVGLITFHWLMVCLDTVNHLLVFLLGKVQIPAQL